MCIFFKILFIIDMGFKQESLIYAGSISSDSISVNPLNTLSLSWLSLNDIERDQRSSYPAVSYLNETTVPSCNQLLMNPNFITVVWLNGFCLAVWLSVVLVWKHVSLCVQNLPKIQYITLREAGMTFPSVWCLGRVYIRYSLYMTQNKFTSLPRLEMFLQKMWFNLGTRALFLH